VHAPFGRTARPGKNLSGDPPGCPAEAGLEIHPPPDISGIIQGALPRNYLRVLTLEGAPPD
jgi:hypothetical protein